LVGCAALAAAAVGSIALGGAPSAAPAASVPPTRPGHEPVFRSMTANSVAQSNAAIAASSNWAGYVVAGPSADSPTSFTSVTGTWKQPRATCGRGSAGAASAVWVGLGGSNASTSPALEQIGTSADCDRTGSPSYYAWYEIVPAPPVSVKLKVVPGDTITTSVNVSGSTVLLQIKNRTRHTSFTTSVGVDAPDLSSAEWIAEAPSLCTSATSCQPVSLANFGTVTFTRAAAIGNGHPGTISDPVFAPTAIQLLPDPYRQAPPGIGLGSGAFGSLAGATPTDLTPDGRSFGVSWQANPSPLISRP
jgi:hypothetical protein